MVGAVTGTEWPVPTHLPKRVCPTPATCECECHDDGRAEQVSRLGESMSAPTNKRNRWRVYGPGANYQDRPSENKAYELVRSLTAAGEVVTVYVWEHGRWVLFEHLEPTEG
jgi:hypothetical protein